MSNNITQITPVISIDIFNSLKSLPENNIVDDNINSLKEIFLCSNNFIVKKKKYISVEKKIKLINKKDTINSKVSIILNKLSETNIDNITIEFIETIKQVNTNVFDNVMIECFLKLINEICFIDIYLNFLKTLYIIYNKIQKHSIATFINLMEISFKIFYDNYKIDNTVYLLESHLLFINNLNEYDYEQIRHNLIILIMHLIKHNILNKDILVVIKSKILNHNKYFVDIHHFFNSLKILNKTYSISTEDKNAINNILLNKKINQRESILLSSLL